MKKRVILLINGIIICLGILIGIKYGVDSKIEKKSTNGKDNFIAIMVKEEGATSYKKYTSSGLPKGDYILNEEKTTCENGGKISDYDSSTGKIKASLLGDDKCYLYFDYNKVYYDAYKQILYDNRTQGYGFTIEDYDNIKSDIQDISSDHFQSGSKYNFLTAEFDTDYNLYALPDDLGYSYFFRGPVKNNWLKFGKEYTSGSCTYDGADVLDISGNTLNTRSACLATTICDIDGEYISGLTNSECGGTYLSDYATFTPDLSSEKDIYWRIVRINGDDSVRIMYYGTTPPTSDSTYAENASERSIGSFTYNSLNSSSSYPKNYFPEYSGFQYAFGLQNACGKCTSPGTIECEIDTSKDTCKSSLSSLQISELFNSVAKVQLELWWETTNLSKYYSSGIVSDGIFCNDRSSINYSTTGEIGSWGYNGTARTSETIYSAYTRLYSNFSTSVEPTLKCMLDKDKFSETSALGNGALYYPVGLLTADEIILAGAKSFNSQFEDYYLKVLSATYLITMTPFYFNSPSSEPTTVMSQEYASDSNSLTALNFTSPALYYPVINLSSTTKIKGSGTWNDPYMVVE